MNAGSSPYMNMDVSESPELDALRYFPVIGELDRKDIESIYPHLTKHTYADGSIVLRQGQASDRFHILLVGELDVYIENKRKVSVAKLSPGHFVGEMSCLTGNVVSATVSAIGTVHTVSMPREGMLLLMDRSRSFRNDMIEAMVKRIGDSNERVVEEHTRSVAVMRQLEIERRAHYGPLIGSSAFMHDLRKKVIQLADQQEPLCIVGEKGVGKLHVAYEIHYRSHRKEFPIWNVDGASFQMDEWEVKAGAVKEGTIVLEHADALPPDVLNRIIHSLDETRLIMTAHQLPPVQARELHLLPLRERVEDIPELVFEFLSAAGVHDPQEAIASEAMNMISAYPYLGENVQELKRVVEDALVVSGGKMIRIHHLRFGRVREPGTRPKVGLALGSGSSRGAAHVGVLKVLEQEGIPVDMIAGTSVGAFIGALYAGGQPISAFEKVLPTVKWRQLVNFTMPPAAFVSNHPMARFVEHYIGPVDFEDLNIPFAAVASDALSGEAYIFNTGRVSHAICASTAIPGVMKPVRHRERLLVDGAVVHPVPVALAKSMGADIVIAVDLSLPAFSNKTPKNFIATVLHTIEIMSKKMVAEELQLADVVLNPRIEQHQISFKSSAYYIKMGEEAAREALPFIQLSANGRNL